MSLPSTPSFRLDGKRALVTGGTRGIGLGAAVALADAGAHVTIAARTAVDVETVVNQMAGAGMAAEGVALDITDVPAVRAFIAEAEPFQVLVNSAGGARHSSFADITEADYQAVMTLNLSATLFVSQAVVGRLIEAGLPGSIIHISSQMGMSGDRTAPSMRPASSLSKASARPWPSSLAPTIFASTRSARPLSKPN
jgi:NAD(P)-dependent dehydrogenase (short-subunit alcohol dehydrogenase family)